MKLISLLDLIKDPKTLLDMVVEHHETLFVQRPEDKSVVILSTEEYNRLKALEYRMKSLERDDSCREAHQ